MFLSRPRVAYDFSSGASRKRRCHRRGLSHGVSVFATVTDFPDTTDFLHRLLKFNGDIDFAKLQIFDDGRIALVAMTPLRLVDKEELTFMLDQVAAANNVAFDRFGKDAKQ